MKDCQLQIVSELFVVIVHSKIMNRININTLIKKEIERSETFWLMQQVHNDDCLSRENVFLWYKRFLKGREVRR